MLKDYFNPNLSPENQCRISESLRRFVLDFTVFSSYSQARYFRSTQDYKDDNGRYHFFIVKYDGFYYLMNKDQRQRFKSLLHSVERDDAWDKRLAKVNAVLDADVSKSVLNIIKE